MIQKYNIGSIEGIFIDNDGGIKNQGQSINKINATFLNNTQEALWNGWGGAVINDVSGQMEGNHRGIFNGPSGQIKNISVNFINNYADSLSESGASGGAIYNSGSIGDISGSFKNNTAKTNGGAIFNEGTIGDITADFENNVASSRGGAIYNSGSIGDISGSFKNNTAKNNGGAIYNKGTINSIKGSFINNSASDSSAINKDPGNGSTIWNLGYIDTIEGYFEGNSGNHAILAYKSALSDDAEYHINLIKGIFKNNNGAIFNNGQVINKIEGIFENNYTSLRGGAILHVTGGGRINQISNSEFISNSVSGDSVLGGGAIYFGRTLAKIDNCNFKGNYVNAISSSALGGAIRNNNADNTSTTIKNSTFTGNHATSATGTALGGAIYSTTDLNIIADNGQSIFKDNYTQSGNQKDDNAIYLDNPDATLNFHLKNNGTIAMYDNIRGASVKVTETDEDGNEIVDEDGNALTSTKHYSVNITGDGTGTFGMYNNIYDANVTLGNTNLNTVNNLTHTYNFNSLTIKDNTNLSLDVDLKNKEMDRFTANNYGEHNGTLNVIGMNLLSDAIDNTTEIYFAEQGLKDNVTNKSGELPDKYQTAYTPIYKYTVSYDNREDGGYFVFNRGGLNGGTPSNPSDAFNPAVLSAPVATTAATQATINETFKYVFEHADAFTQLPSVERLSRINANKYAINNNNKYNGYSTTYNQNMGSLSQRNNSAAWFRPYVTFETMHLKNGPKVNAITYGSLAGFDTDFNEHKHGWHSVGTGYIGYNGSPT